jgi:hypothetical protein
MGTTEWAGFHRAFCSRFAPLHTPLHTDLGLVHPHVHNR